ncbi:MAG TPA: LysR family transcriptional regulator [Rhizomicrobium sp.]|nr:LysR family transcriptional regulator [Rhizomicrobium sp.]
MSRLTIRIDFGTGAALGPGKVRLLELVDETGSIRKAAAGMNMSYRRAWLLLKALREAFGAPLVVTATGGKAGGGASLTALGRFVVGRYRVLERAAAKAGNPSMVALERRLAPISKGKALPRKRIQR